MKSTDFSLYLQKFFKIYVVSDRNLSNNTIESYSKTFSLFLKFMKDEVGIKISDIKLSNFSRENVLKFLRYLETKGNSPKTINQRKAALSCFCDYLKYEVPDIIADLDSIIAIHQKKYIKKTISYMKTEGINLFLKQINTNTINGLRDFIVVGFMVLMGLRVSEVINIKISDIQQDEYPTLKILGKGRKERLLCIPDQLYEYVKKYIEIINKNKEHRDIYLFLNHENKQFTRFGVDYIVKKYRDMARKISPDIIPEDLSCHKLRHSCGAAMARAGVDIVYIRDIFGHASITTTQVYIGAVENETKKEILGNLANDMIDGVETVKPVWSDNVDIMDFLDGLSKSFHK